MCGVRRPPRPDPRRRFPRFAAEPGRYHRFVANNCPWAHRTVIIRNLKALEEAISFSIVEPEFGAEGWYFGDGPGPIPDTVNGFSHLRQLYSAARPDYTGRRLSAAVNPRGVGSEAQGNIAMER